jgi:hypothetical protein
METIWTGFQLIDLVIAMTLLEAAALAIYHQRTGKGLSPREFLPNLVAGLSLMFALRVGQSPHAWGWVALGLSCAGLAHAADVYRRLLRRRQR